jgi:hypothetical protein
MDIRNDIIRIAKSLYSDAPYDGLNDAASTTGNMGYSIGNTGIWYAKDSFTRDSFMGYSWLEKNNLLPDPKRLQEKYVFLGRIHATNPNEIYKMMQGHNWSPDGEANIMLRRKSIGHTSMSVGDIIVIGNKTMMADTGGWKDLNSPSNTANKGKETIREIKEFVKKIFRMTPDEEDSDSIEFSTRDNGDVEEEQASPFDVQQMKKIRDSLKKEFGESGIKYRIEIIDEWVYLSISIA